MSISYRIALTICLLPTDIDLMRSCAVEEISLDQDKDTGLLVCLILLVISVYTDRLTLLPPAMAILLVAMLRPGLFHPLARLWFGLSDLLGKFSSKLILSLVFFIVVTPMGLLRRTAGKDAMRLKSWKGDEKSALFERNHLYVARDLERPY